eukprot:TRINITY_DN3626_c0_g1_i2.p1 TRINITY_DN3626_c0_g1~~TRINITY_DN3626_c0_g1_i2.p1  ORF type:complete len:262 (-),score=63.01 TRINITY_DN3626_c0_g1_i2:368-1153(-)
MLHPRAADTPAGAAEEHAECPICFEPLNQHQVGVLVDDTGRRISQHLFNYQAACLWAEEHHETTRACPVTRARFSRVVRLPDLLSDPHHWFQMVDLDGDGKLSRREVVEVLKAQLPVDVGLLEAVAMDPQSEMWRRWDPDGSGFIDEHELLAPNGLIWYVQDVCRESGHSRAIPSIRDKKAEWFAFWDEDHSQSLEKEEIVRALVHTFQLGKDYVKLQSLKGTIDAIWPMFDADGSGSIEMCEFLGAEGLANTIIATMDFA